MQSAPGSGTSGKQGQLNSPSRSCSSYPSMSESTSCKPLSTSSTTGGHGDPDQEFQEFAETLSPIPQQVRQLQFRNAELIAANDEDEARRGRTTTHQEAEMVTQEATTATGQLPPPPPLPRTSLLGSCFHPEHHSLDSKTFSDRIMQGTQAVARTK